MIAELLTTIIMALGVATGNVTSNSYKGGNAFNNELSIDKTPPSKQQANVNYYMTVNHFWNAQEYETSTRNFTRKWYLGDYNNPTYNDTYINIYNTIYCCERTGSNYISNAYILMKITPQYVLQNPQITMKMVLENTNTVEYQNVTLEWYTCRMNYRMNDLIDMSLTNNTNEVLEGALTNEYIEEELDVYSTTIQTQNIGQYFEREVDISVIGTYDFYFFSRIQTYYSLSQIQQGTTRRFQPSGIEMTSDILVPTYNYEVVDIPNLMYTILTMPFSFISTAFNLTLFPNTPYALNFGNLFLTIVAVFILFYILRKILK